MILFYIYRFKKQRTEFSLKTMLKSVPKNGFAQGHDLVPNLAEGTLCNCAAPVCIIVHLNYYYQTILSEKEMQISMSTQKLCFSDALFTTTRFFHKCVLSYGKLIRS